MKHTIEIDSKSTAGKSLLSIARELSKNDKNILIDSEEKAVKKITIRNKPKSQLLRELEQSVHNLNRVKQGKLKAKPLSDLLNEL